MTLLSMGRRNSNQGSLPLGSRHHAHVRKLLVGVLGPIAASQCLDQAYDFTAPLES